MAKCRTVLNRRLRSFDSLRSLRTPILRRMLVLTAIHPAKGAGWRRVCHDKENSNRPTTRTRGPPYGRQSHPFRTSSGKDRTWRCEGESARFGKRPLRSAIFSLHLLRNTAKETALDATAGNPGWTVRGAGVRKNKDLLGSHAVRSIASKAGSLNFRMADQPS